MADVSEMLPLLRARTEYFLPILGFIQELKVNGIGFGKSIDRYEFPIIDFGASRYSFQVTPECRYCIEVKEEDNGFFIQVDIYWTYNRKSTRKMSREKFIEYLSNILDKHGKQIKKRPPTLGRSKSERLAISFIISVILTWLGYVLWTSSSTKEYPRKNFIRSNMDY